MAKALVLGGKKGLLGQALTCELENQKYTVSTVDWEDGDFSSPDFVAGLLNNEKADIVFNTLAWTRVDDAETNENEADEANRIIPLNIASALSTMQAGRLVHYSTDFVFSGEQRDPYKENAAPCPLNIYGKTKLGGEKAVQQYLPERSCIIRTAWLFGPGKKNFITTILAACLKKNEISVVDDQTGSPTYTPDLAKWSVLLARKKANGIWNGVNSGQASWCELASEAVALARHPCHIQPISSSQWPQKALRPRYSVLDNTRLGELIGIKPRPWVQALRDYIYGHLLNSGGKILENL